MENKTASSQTGSAAALSPEELANCTRLAQKEAVYAGLTSALLGGLIGARLLKFDRNRIILSGILTGVASGYFFTQAFLATHIAEARAAKHLDRGNSSQDGFVPDQDDSSSRP